MLLLFGDTRRPDRPIFTEMNDKMFLFPHFLQIWNSEQFYLKKPSCILKKAKSKYKIFLRNILKLNRTSQMPDEFNLRVFVSRKESFFVEFVLHGKLIYHSFLCR